MRDRLQKWRPWIVSMRLLSLSASAGCDERSSRSVGAVEKAGGLTEARGVETMLEIYDSSLGLCLRVSALRQIKQLSLGFVPSECIRRRSPALYLQGIEKCSIRISR